MSSWPPAHVDGGSELRCLRSVPEDPEDPECEEFIHLSKGICTRTEINIYHTVYAITDMTIVAMLTNQWDHSDPPIIRVDD